MTRVQSSIAQLQPASQRGLNRRMRHWMSRTMQWIEPVITQSARQCGADLYRKHFFARMHAWLLIHDGLGNYASLRQSYDAFDACPALLARSGLADAFGTLSVSYSQYAASNTTRPAAFLGGVLGCLIERIRRCQPAAIAKMPLELRIIDTTFLYLSLKLAPWVRVKRQQGGLMLQVEYVPGLDLPDRILISDAHSNDYNRLDQAILDDPVHLQALQDQTLIIDLGYYSHDRFRRLHEAGIHWITRLHSQAKVQIERELPVPQRLMEWHGGRITILSHQVITLGSENNRKGCVITDVYRVRAQVEPHPKASKKGRKAVIYDLITDRANLTAEEIAQAYVDRWRIELFFRWLKSHIQITRWLGYSENAVHLTIYRAILVHLLCLLAVAEIGWERRWPGLIRKLGHLLEQIEPPPLDSLSNAYQYALPGDGLSLAALDRY